MMRTWTALTLSLILLATIACQPTIERPLRILTENYPPHNFIGADKQVTGQSTEVVQEILKKLGKPATVIEVLPLSEGLAIVEKGPAAAIYSINRTAQRENRFKWVGSIGAYEQALYARKGTGMRVTSLDEAREINGLIAVYKGDAGNHLLQSQGFTNLDESPDDVQALKKLMEGKAALWLGNREGLVITAIDAGVNSDDLELQVPVLRSELYLALSKDTPDATIKSWQSALDELKTAKGSDGRTFFENVALKYADATYLRKAIARQ